LDHGVQRPGQIGHGLPLRPYASEVGIQPFNPIQCLAQRSSVGRGVAFRTIGLMGVAHGRREQGKKMNAAPLPRANATKLGENLTQVRACFRPIIVTVKLHLPRRNTCNLDHRNEGR
jgi:hypothetical protein